MSTTGINPDLDRMFKRTFHQRHDSTDLDVFEAARYFSADATSFTEKFMLREEIRNRSDYWSRGGLGGGRSISLDLPTTRSHHNSTAADQKQPPIKDKNCKQPRSPGARLASFLNSLFSQSSKKKSKSAAPDGEIPGGATRKRRSSISHFSFGSSNSYNKRNHSVYSKNSGLCTPPATSAKNDPRSLSDRKHYLHCNGHEIRRNPDFSWLDHEKFRFRDGLSERNDYFRSNCRYHEELFKNDYDDGAESDSSSDLFELQNYDSIGYSSSLPVYETTRLDLESINRGAPISATGP